MLRLVLLTALAVSLASSTPGMAATVNLNPIKDNTLYDNTLFPLSNGAGDHFFAGQTTSSQFSLRRGLIAFDIAGNVPNGAIITNVRLLLHMSRTQDSTPRFVTLHVLQADWGEGASHAPGNEGGGTNATPGDATWLHTFFNGSFWGTNGGDFNAAASATSIVGNAIGTYTWMNPAMVTDVQNWLDNPATNFGWLVLGNESTAPTSRRFDSRENADPSRRPVLEVTYTEGQVAVEETTWSQVKALLSGK